MASSLPMYPMMYPMTARVYRAVEPVEMVCEARVLEATFCQEAPGVEVEIRIEQRLSGSPSMSRCLSEPHRQWVVHLYREQQFINAFGLQSWSFSTRNGLTESGLLRLRARERREVARGRGFFRTERISAEDVQKILAANPGDTVSLPSLGEIDVTHKDSPGGLQERIAVPPVLGPPRVLQYASVTALIINVDEWDALRLTQQCTPCGFMKPIGTPVDGQFFTIEIQDDGRQQDLYFSNQGFWDGAVTFPERTSGGKLPLSMTFIYSEPLGKWNLAAKSAGHPTAERVAALAEHAARLSADMERLQRARQEEARRQENMRVAQLRAEREERTRKLIEASKILKPKPPVVRPGRKFRFDKPEDK